MNDSQTEWLKSGRGLPPEQRWSFVADAPLLSMQLARETNELLVADTSGGIYLLNRRGQITTLTRGFQHLRAIAWSDTGNGGAAAVGAETLCLLDRDLKVHWSIDLADEILDVAVDPFGNHVAVSLANGNNLVFDRHKNRVCRFDTIRPLSFISFVPTARQIIGTAEYGLICCHEFAGPQIWNEKTWSNVGNVSVAGGANLIHVASFSHGILTFSVADGSTRGSYQMEGTPNRVACSYTANRMVVTTLERHIYWLDGQAELIWASHLADDVNCLQCESLGAGVVCGFASGRIVALEWGIPEGD